MRSESDLGTRQPSPPKQVSFQGPEHKVREILHTCQTPTRDDAIVLSTKSAAALPAGK